MRSVHNRGVNLWRKSGILSIRAGMSEESDCFPAAVIPFVGNERHHSAISFLSLPKNSEIGRNLAAKGIKQRPHPFRCHTNCAACGVKVF